MKNSPRWHYAAILLFPGLLWWLNPNWLFQNPGHMDPWYYFGAFRFFPRFHNLWPSYATERMTWIAPGYVFVRVFGQVAGVALLHCCLFLLSLFAVHYILRRLTDSRTAFVSTLLLGANPFFIECHSKEYLEGVSMVSLLLAIALLIRAWEAPGGGGVYLFLSAMAWAALVYTYLAWAILTPIYLWLAVYLGQRAVRVAGCAFAGWLATTLAVAAAYYGLGGKGLFVGETLKAALGYSRLAGGSFFANSNWHKDALWLVLPALAAAIGAVWLVSRRSGLSRGCAAVLGFQILCVATMAVLALVNHPVLELDFFCAVLTPCVFLALAVTLWRVPESIHPLLFYAAAGWGVFLGVVSLVRRDIYLLGRHWGVIAVLILTLVALGCAAAWRRQGSFRWASGVVVFGGLSVMFGPAFAGPAWKMEYRGWDFSERVSRAMNLVAGRLSPQQAPIFWIDDYNDPLTNEYRGVMCAFLTHGRSMWRFPELDAGKRYPAGTRLVLLTPKKDAFLAASGVLEKAGMPVALIGQDLVDYGGVSYWITQLEVRAPS